MEADAIHLKPPRVATLFALAALLCAVHAHGVERLSRQDEVFLNTLEYRSCMFFLNEADPKTGLVPDAAPNRDGAGDASASSSVAGGGFGLAALCIADERKWITRTQAVLRARAALRFVAANAPHENGFLYHFIDRNTGDKHGNSEVSPIDTAIFLCGALAARRHFDDPEIRALATKIYERVNWPWMLNGGDTLCMGWKLGEGFSRHRWHGYAEHMAMYLLGIGSPTHPLSAETWHAWRREPVGTHGGKTFIQYPPLFVHQYAHAFVDFRNLSDDYADYWQNSVFATLANRKMCLDLREQFPGYSENIWGVTASLGPGGYHAWGGPPATPDLDGTVVPCAPGGSIPFAPRECIAALRAMHDQFGDRVWGRYGFADAFSPKTGWTARDVLAIDAGITLVMIENFRSGLVWDRFMANPEIGRAMQAAGFRPAPKLAENTSLLEGREPHPPARQRTQRSTVAHKLPLADSAWNWELMDANNARESVFDGENKIFVRFAFAWDEAALHVRALVTDPDPARGDKLELYLDPEDDGFQWGDYRDFLWNFSPTNDTREALGRNGITSSVTAVKDGYRVIAAIPWKDLGIASPYPGLILGCSPGAYSVSPHEEPAAKLNWNWREDDHGGIRLGTLTLLDP